MPLPVRDLWYKFVRLCETKEYQAMPYVLVNGAAGDIEHFTKGADIIADLSARVAARMMVLWLIDDMLDTVQNLVRFVRALEERCIPQAEWPEILVVCNEQQDEYRTFEIYEQSEIRKQVLGLGGREINVPSFSLPLRQGILSKRLSIEQCVGEAAANELVDSSIRMEAGRARQETTKIFDEAGIIEGVNSSSIVRSSTPLATGTV